MVKIQVSYENQIEEIKVLEMFKHYNIKDIKKPKKTGKYYKMYIFIE